MTANNIRVGIIGLGHIGKIHAAALRESPCFELVGACDRQAGIASVVPESAKFYASHHEMLRDGGFDTVIVATPNRTHNAMAIEALRAGFHVIVEKPAAANMEELDALEDAARVAGRHVYYAFHAAQAFEVAWLAGHLRENRDKYGPLTAFFSRFYDPYINEHDRLEAHAMSLDECWSDSGVNALSVLDAVLAVEGLRVVSRRQSGQSDKPPGLRGVSVQFCFAARGDNSGLGVIETAWDQGVNFKCTELYFGTTGHRLVVNHSAQSVTECTPDGKEQTLVEFAGDRLFSHYLGLFADYRARFKDQNMNTDTARRVHELLFAAFRV